MNESAKYVALALVAARDQHYEEAAVLFTQASKCEDCDSLVEALSSDSLSAGPGVGQETMQDIPQDRLFNNERPLDRGEQWGDLENINGARKHVTLDDEEGSGESSDDEGESDEDKDPNDLESFDEDDELAVSTSSILSAGRDLRRRRSPTAVDRSVRILSQSMAAAADEPSSDDSSDELSDEESEDEDTGSAATSAEKDTRSGLYEDNSDFLDEHGGPKAWTGIRHPVADESATLHKNPLIPGRTLSLMSDAIPGKELDDHGEPVDDEDVLVPEIDPDIPGTVAIPASFSHKD